MNLPTFGKKKSPLFVSVLISGKSVACALWEVQEGIPAVRGYSSIVDWNAGKEETFVQAVDAAIASLGKPAESAKHILFGFPESWVTGQTIAKEKKHLLKLVTTKLELESVGFVVVSEAVIADLKVRQDAHLQGVYVWIEEGNLTLTIVKQGTVEDIASVGRSESIVPDVIEGISRCKQKDIPSRIILFSLDEDNTTLLAYQQELLHFEWTTTLFAQLPSVEILHTEQVLDAISVTGGKEVARSLGLLDHVAAGVSSGVAVGEVAPTQSQPSAFEPIVPMEATVETEPEAQSLSVHEVRGTVITKSRIIMGASLLTGVAVIVIGGLIAITTQIRADVRLRIRSQDFTLPVTMTIDAEAQSSDATKDVLKGTNKIVEIKGSKEIPTTGKKNVGEKATGTVTIFNKTTQPKTFKAGTLLKEGSKRSFVTTEAVTIASASSTISETVHGKATVKVTAEKIGEEGNANKNVELTVSNFDVSAFVARTETEITGGSSKTVSAVASKDHSDLLNLVTQESKKTAQEKLDQTIESDEKTVLSDALTIGKKVYSADVGKEAESVSLTMTASASAVVYKQIDLAEFAAIKLNEQLPAQSKLKPEQTVLDVTSSKVINSHTIQVTGMIKGQYVSSVSSEQISKLLSGKKLEEARQLLDSQSTIGSYTITMKPQFIAPLYNTLPKDSRKISVVTSIE